MDNRKQFKESLISHVIYLASSKTSIVCAFFMSVTFCRSIFFIFSFFFGEPFSNWCHIFFGIKTHLQLVEWSWINIEPENFSLKSKLDGFLFDSRIATREPFDIAWQIYAMDMKTGNWPHSITFNGVFVIAVAAVVVTVILLFVLYICLYVTFCLLLRLIKAKQAAE